MAAEPTSPNLPFVDDYLFKDGVDFMTVTGVVDNPYIIDAFEVEATNVEIRARCARSTLPRKRADWGSPLRWHSPFV
jgi:hypothetical protein